MSEEIRMFDFESADWYSAFLDRSVTLRRGAWRDDSGSEAVSAELADEFVPSFADLDGDSDEDAVVTLQSVRDNGGAREIYAWLWDEGGARQIEMPIFGDGRCGDSITTMAVEPSGEITIEFLDGRFHESCADGSQVTARKTFRIEGGVPLQIEPLRSTAASCWPGTEDGSSPQRKYAFPEDGPESLRAAASDDAPVVAEVKDIAVWGVAQDDQAQDPESWVLVWFVPKDSAGFDEGRPPCGWVDARDFVGEGL